MPCVLTPLDGTDQALVAVPVARELATLLDADLRFVHVTEDDLAPADLLERLRIDRDILNGSLVELRHGDPAAEITRAIDETGATAVLCTRTGPRVPEVAMGPVAHAVLRDATGPIVLVRPERTVRPWHLRRLLLPYDGTPTTARAVGPVAELARAAGAELRVLHVATLGESEERGAMSAPRYLDQPQHEWPSWAEEFVQRLGCFCGLDDVKVRLIMGHGEPAAETLRAAEEVDLVVLAWRGRFEADRAPIVKRVLEFSPCPVLVLRTR